MWLAESLDGDNFMVARLLQPLSLCLSLSPPLSMGRILDLAATSHVVLGCLFAASVALVGQFARANCFAN